ncbi:MAG: hypothetical protein JXA53_00315, partial [Bacteroidales bacterium]|nr:hypothetical protein [Bacteroidales bacterium]
MSENFYRRILFSLLIFCLFISSLFGEQLTLSGKIKNYSKSVCYLYNLDLESSIAEQSISLEIDDSHNFIVDLDLDSPKYFELFGQVVFLLPGHNLQLELDYLEPESVNFIGYTSDQCYYLHKVFNLKKANIFSTIPLNLKIQQVGDIINELLAPLYSNLYSGFLHPSNYFVKTELLRLKSIYFNMLFSYPFEQAVISLNCSKNSKSLITIYELYSDDMFNFINQHSYKSCLDTKEYREVLTLFFNHVDKDLIDRLYSKSWLLDYFFITNQLFQFSLNPTENSMKSLFENIKESLYNRELLASIELLEEQYKQLDEGQIAIDLVVVGLDNRRHNLSELQGKLLVINFWAVWNKESLIELNYINKLKDKYKGHNQDLEFISISI